jgi:hypothetical protein
MPLALLLIGAFLGLLAINGKYADALTLIGNSAKKAPGGSVSLLEAFAGIILVAALFRAVELPRAGEAFLVLLVVVFLTIEGDRFLTKFESAAAGIGSGSASASSGSGATSGGASPAAPSGGSIYPNAAPATGGSSGSAPTGGNTP